MSIRSSWLIVLFRLSIILTDFLPAWSFNYWQRDAEASNYNYVSFSCNPLLLYWNLIGGVVRCEGGGEFYNLPMESPSFSGLASQRQNLHKCFCSSSRNVVIYSSILLFYSLTAAVYLTFGTLLIFSLFPEWDRKAGFGAWFPFLNWGKTSTFPLVSPFRWRLDFC